MVQGIFSRRVNRRLAEVEIDGEMFETYISNGIEMSFLKTVQPVSFVRHSIRIGEPRSICIPSMIRIRWYVSMLRSPFMLRKSGAQESLLTSLESKSRFKQMLSVCRFLQ